MTKKNKMLEQEYKFWTKYIKLRNEIEKSLDLYVDLNIQMEEKVNLQLADDAEEIFQQINKIRLNSIPLLINSAILTSHLVKMNPNFENN